MYNQLVPGINIDILRTDGCHFWIIVPLNIHLVGRVHSAIIRSVNEKNSVITVEWYEKGESKGKEVSLINWRNDGQWYLDWFRFNFWFKSILKKYGKCWFDISLMTEWTYVKDAPHKSLLEPPKINRHTDVDPVILENTDSLQTSPTSTTSRNKIFEPVLPTTTDFECQATDIRGVKKTDVGPLRTKKECHSWLNNSANFICITVITNWSAHHRLLWVD